MPGSATPHACGGGLGWGLIAGHVRARYADPAAGAAAGARAALGAAGGAVPDQAARTGHAAAGRRDGAAADAIRPCSICGNLDTADPCAICRDPERDPAEICVVEDLADLWALERTGAFRGRYHVLGGTLSAIDGVGPDELNIAGLIARLGPETELILALNATVEGQTTAHYIADRAVVLARAFRGWRRVCRSAASSTILTRAR